MYHTSKLSEGATREQAIKLLLHDHSFFLGCDPHLVKFEPLAPSSGSTAGSTAAPALPESIKPLGETRMYRVTDSVQTLPAGLWDSIIDSTYEITDTADGIFVRIRSPLSVVMDTLWEIREAADSGDGGDGGDGGGGGEAGTGAGRLELVEDVTINCSRFLSGTVKNLCESGWGKIHAKMLTRLEGGDGAKN